MISQAFIVFKHENGQFVPHDHPVFADQVAYDLPNAQQQIAIDPEYNCRAFTSPNEVYSAITDYMRQAADPQVPESWYTYQKCSISNFQPSFKTR
jgi:hypothetical protein